MAPNGVDIQKRPALFDHCNLIWDGMLERAHPEEDADGNKYLIYTGFLTKLFRESGLSVPYYSSVMTAMQKMDCVRQQRRGGGNSPSEWLLVQKPTIELFRARMDMPTGKVKSPKAENMDQLRQGQKDLNTRVTSLESQVQYLLALVPGPHNREDDA